MVRKKKTVEFVNSGYARYLELFRILITIRTDFYETADYCDWTTNENNNKNAIHIFNVQRLGIASFVFLNEI